MPRELSWYLEELRKKHTPRHDPNNSFDVMYDALQELDDAIRKNDLNYEDENRIRENDLNDEKKYLKRTNVLGDEEKNRDIINKYAMSIDAAQRYFNQRATSFFGPSSWETDTGLLGKLLKDLSDQFRVMNDMSARQTDKRNQFQLFRHNHGKDIKEDIFDSYGPTYDTNLNVPQNIKEELKVGSISTGRGVLGKEAEQERNRHIISRIPPRFVQAGNQAPENAQPELNEVNAQPKPNAEEARKAKQLELRGNIRRETYNGLLTNALDGLLTHLYHPKAGEADFFELIRNTDFGAITQQQEQAFVTGAPVPGGNAGNNFLGNPAVSKLIAEHDPFPFGGSRRAHEEFRRAFLDTCKLLKQEKTAIDNRFSQLNVGKTRISNYVKGTMVEDHGYFSYGGGDPQEAAKAAGKKEKLRKALNDLAERIYEEPAVQEFTDDSPEAREQFASGIQVPENQRYNSIETNRQFLDLVAEADPFSVRNDENNINNINNGGENADMPENQADPEAVQDSRIFRRAVFDMVTACARIRKDARRNAVETGEPEECAAAASRLAYGLGAGLRVEQVVRVRGNGRDGKNVYLKNTVPGKKPSGPNLISPEQFAGEGAVLDSGELARQLSEIQVVRYLTGTSGKGVGDLRFAFSNDRPKKITGITDVNMGGAFPDDPAAEGMTPGSLTVMSRSTADRIMTISPERLGAVLGSRIGGRGLENAKTRLAELQQAIQESLDRKWAMDDSLLPGRLHVVEDATFSKLSIKQIASVQDNNGIKGLFSQTYSGMILKGKQAAEENTAYPGGFYQRQLNTLMESQGEKKSSPEFTNALEAVKKVNTEINRYMHEDREMTAEEMSALRKTYTESIVEVNKYIKATRGWHWTSRGDVRHNAMAVVQGYMEQELKALNEYDPGHHWKIEKIIQHGRQEEIPAIQGAIEYVGGNVNSRQVLTINGKKGAFTPRKEYHEPTDREIGDVMIDTTTVPEDIKADVTNAALAAWQRLRTIAKDHTATLLYKKNPDIYEEAGKGFLEREDVKALNKVFKELNAPELTDAQDPESRAFRRHVAERIRAGLLLRNERNVMNSAGIADRENLDQRNTAMSVMADLVEMPNAVARARDVRVTVNGGRQVGTFQEWAEGDVIGNQDFIKGSDFCRYNSNLMTKEALQQLSDIQALDFICGNIDRHLNNMTFKFEDINGEHRLVKITGIDNDTSFGTIKMSDYKEPEADEVFAFPQHMLMMKQSTANAILNLRKDTLEVALRPYIHGAGELDACWNRVQGLQKQLQADMNYPFVGKTNLTDGHIRIFEDDDPVWDSFRPGDLANNNTVIGLFARAALQADETKRKRDSKPDKYELEKSIRQGLDFTENYRMLDLHPMLEVTKINALANVMANRKKEPDFMASLYRDMPKATMTEYLNPSSDGGYVFKEAEQVLLNLFPGRDLNDIIGHEVCKEAGYKNSLDFFYVDGVPAREFLRENYPKLFQTEEFLAQPDLFQDLYWKGMMGSLMTSGRHHIDMVVPAMESNGHFTVGITELEFDVDQLAGTEGFFGTSRESRQDKLLNDGTRADRFRAIEEKVVAKMEEAAYQLDGKIISGVEKPLREKYKKILDPKPVVQQVNQQQVNQPQVNLQPQAGHVADPANQPQVNLQQGGQGPQPGPQPVVPGPQQGPQPVVPGPQQGPQPVVPGPQQGPQGNQGQEKAAHNAHTVGKESVSFEELLPEQPGKKNFTLAKEKDSRKGQKKAGKPEEGKPEEGKKEEGKKESVRSQKGK